MPKSYPPGYMKVQKLVEPRWLTKAAKTTAVTLIVSGKTA
jgi:hypothetical protein